jgi:hypothetical protein
MTLFFVFVTQSRQKTRDKAESTKHKERNTTKI